MKTTDTQAMRQHLADLSAAHEAAQAEESQLLAKLAAPAGQPSALARAAALLAGKPEPARQDRDGLNQRLDEVRQRVALLAAAIEEQRAAIAALLSTESAAANAQAQPRHVEAAQGIAKALQGLADALAKESAIRREIAAAGYAVSLEPLERPELNPADSQSELARFAADVRDYLSRCELQEKKAVNVRLLVDRTEGRAGDVLAVPGSVAAMLVGMGHAEVTTAKPSRMPQQAEAVELILS